MGDLFFSQWNINEMIIFFFFAMKIFPDNLCFFFLAVEFI